MRISQPPVGRAGPGLQIFNRHWAEPLGQGNSSGDAKWHSAATAGARPKGLVVLRPVLLGEVVVPCRLSRSLLRQAVPVAFRWLVLLVPSPTPSRAKTLRALPRVSPSRRTAWTTAGDISRRQRGGRSSSATTRASGPAWSVFRLTEPPIGSMRPRTPHPQVAKRPQLAPFQGDMGMGIVTGTTQGRPRLAPRSIPPRRNAQSGRRVRRICSACPDRPPRRLLVAGVARWPALFMSWVGPPGNDWQFWMGPSRTGFEDAPEGADHSKTPPAWS